MGVNNPQFGDAQETDIADVDAEGGWGDEMGLDDGSPQIGASSDLDVDLDDGEGGWDLGDVDVDLEGLPTPKHSDLAGFYAPPTKGSPVKQLWSQRSNAIADQVAAGSFDVARNMLESELGIVELAPLKDVFLALSTSSYAALTMGSPQPPRMQGIHRWGAEDKKPTQFPAVCISLESLGKQMQAGYDFFTKGKFVETKEAFLNVLHKIPFVVSSTKPQLNDLRKLLAICKEYVLAMNVELFRRQEQQSSPVSARVCELAAYFTHFNIEPKHLVLALRQVGR